MLPCNFLRVFHRGDICGQIFSQSLHHYSKPKLAGIGLNIKRNTISKRVSCLCFPAKNEYKIKFHESKIHVCLIHYCIPSY